MRTIGVRPSRPASTASRTWARLAALAFDRFYSKGYDEVSKYLKYLVGNFHEINEALLGREPALGLYVFRQRIQYGAGQFTVFAHTYSEAVDFLKKEMSQNSKVFESRDPALAADDDTYEAQVYYYDRNLAVSPGVSTLVRYSE